MRKIITVDGHVDHKIKGIITWTPARVGEFVEFMGTPFVGKVIKAYLHPRWPGWFMYDVEIEEK